MLCILTEGRKHGGNQARVGVTRCHNGWWCSPAFRIPHRAVHGAYRTLASVKTSAPHAPFGVSIRLGRGFVWGVGLFGVLILGPTWGDCRLDQFLKILFGVSFSRLHRAGSWARTAPVNLLKSCVACVFDSPRRVVIWWRLLP